jgi:hypothetical protein
MSTLPPVNPTGVDITADEYYTLSNMSTVTVEGCPYCEGTHVFSIDPGLVPIQKSNISQPRLPGGVRKFIVECPKQRALFEIYVKVG